ncbi:MAG: CAF17-like 4Fe-4S cluster assembly/insertion protein YgfZ [Acidiferrobacterales bacterium]
MIRSSREWQDFLRGVGAVLADDKVAHFEDPQSELRRAAGGDVMADLSHLSLIAADGEEAGSFLQAQLSNDIRLVTATHSELAAYCSPQGRMFAIFRVLMRDGFHFLQLPSSLMETTLKRMKMFILRAKVKLADADADWVRVGVSGPNAMTILSDAGLVFPDAANDCMTNGGITVLRLAGPTPRFEIIGCNEAMQRLWTQLRARLAPVGASAWSWLDIAAGLPVVLPGTVEQFVPQMANLDLVGGINFKKGCYPGQEIVARMHYLGRLKQRMIRARVATAKRPEPGTPVYAPDFVGQSAGTVVDAQPGPDDGFELLAVVQISSIRKGEFHLDSPTGPKLQRLELPYSIEPVSETAGAGT